MSSQENPYRSPPRNESARPPLPFAQRVIAIGSFLIATLCGVLVLAFPFFVIAEWDNLSTGKLLQSSIEFLSILGLAIGFFGTGYGTLCRSPVIRFKSSMLLAGSTLLIGVTMLLG